jgi:hypothetical protein
VGEADYLEPLLAGGYRNDPLFGGNEPENIPQLNGYQVYAIAVPNTASHFNFGYSEAGVEMTAYAENLSEGEAFYLTGLNRIASGCTSIRPLREIGPATAGKMRFPT